MTFDEYKDKKERILYIKSGHVIREYASCINPEMCAKCQGRGCCKNFPCAFSPEEFLDIHNTSYMMRLLKTGLITLVKLSRNTLYIRTRGKKDPSTIVVDSKIGPGNPCLLLTDKGCLLDEVFRPTEALLVIPQNQCEPYYKTRHMLRDWSLYKTDMLRLAEQCQNIDIEKKEITSEDIDNYKRIFLSL